MIVGIIVSLPPPCPPPASLMALQGRSSFKGEVLVATHFLIFFELHLGEVNFFVLYHTHISQLWIFPNEPGDWIVEELVDAVYRVGANQGESPKRPEYKYSTDADTNTPIG